MKPFKIIIGIFASIGLIAVIGVGTTMIKKHMPLRHSLLSPPVIETPFFYHQIGDTRFEPPKSPLRYSLELFECQDEVCVQQQLEDLSKIGLEGSFSLKLENTFHIRKGLFETPQGAELAQKELHDVYQINSTVVAL